MGRQLTRPPPFTPSAVEGGRLLGVVGLLGATIALAHPQGFHTKLTFTVSKGVVRGLVVMDVDSGERCRLIRAGADSNHDGELKGEEVEGLKARLVALATKALKVSFSGFALVLPVKEAKLSLREDRRVSDGGLSVAVLLELAHAHEVSPGMSFEVVDVSPDQSPVVVEVFQAAAAGAPPEAPVRVEVESGKQTRVRLGRLGGDPPSGG